MNGFNVTQLVARAEPSPVSLAQVCCLMFYTVSSIQLESVHVPPGADASADVRALGLVPAL